MGIVAMMGNHHDIIIQNFSGPNAANHLVAQICIGVEIRGNINRSGNALRESNTQNGRSIVEIRLLGGFGSIIGVHKVPVCTAITGFHRQITDTQNIVFVGNKTIFLRIKDIKLNTGNFKMFTGMRLVISGVGEISHKNLQNRCHIPGGATALVIDIIHKVLNIDLVMVFDKEPGNAVIVVRVRMGNEPGVDDYLLPFALTGQFPAKFHKVCANLIAPLLNIAAIIDKQAVIRHTDDHHRATVTGTGGIILRGGQRSVITIGSHGQAIHHHGHLCLFIGITDVSKSTGIAFYDILGSIRNDTDFLICMQIVHGQNKILIGRKEPIKIVVVSGVIGFQSLRRGSGKSGALKHRNVSHRLQNRAAGNHLHIRLGAIICNTVTAVHDQSVGCNGSSGLKCRNLP